MCDIDPSLIFDIAYYINIRIISMLSTCFKWVGFFSFPKIFEYFVISFMQNNKNPIYTLNGITYYCYGLNQGQLSSSQRSVNCQNQCKLSGIKSEKWNSDDSHRVYSTLHKWASIFLFNIFYLSYLFRFTSITRDVTMWG